MTDSLERQLARLRAKRQAGRVGEARRARRRRRQVELALTAAVAGTLVVTLLTRGSSTVEATRPATAAPRPTACSYPPHGTATRDLPGLPTSAVLPSGTVSATLATDHGTLTLSLDATTAPCSVSSFAFLAGHGFFDGTRCTRLATDLHLLECGSDDTPGYTIGSEALTGATYPRGTIALVNRGPGTSGSAFFLVAQDSPLPPTFTPLGTITQGLPVLDAVVAAGSDPPSDGNARQPLTLTSVRVARQALAHTLGGTP